MREFLDACGQRPLSYSRKVHGDARLCLGMSEWIIEKEKILNFCFAFASLLKRMIG